MKKVHVVFGSTGEYSDYHEWSVKAFLEKRKATAFAKQCQKLFEAQGFDYWKYEHMEWKHPLDKRWEMDYTSTKYHVISVPLEDGT